MRGRCVSAHTGQRLYAYAGHTYVHIDLQRRAVFEKVLVCAPVQCSVANVAATDCADRRRGRNLFCVSLGAASHRHGALDVLVCTPPQPARMVITVVLRIAR